MMEEQKQTHTHNVPGSSTEILVNSWSHYASQDSLNLLRSVVKKVCASIQLKKA